MGRMVKEQFTGEIMDSSKLFKVTKRNSKGKKINKYYLSEEKYNDYIEYRPKVIDYLWTDILEYKEGMKMPGVILRKVKELESYGYEVILNTLISNRDNINWALNNKQFLSETGKAMYIMAIINNHIMDEYKKFVRDKKAKEKMAVPTENELLDIVVDDEIKNRKQETKDISSFLDEE